MEVHYKFGATNVTKWHKLCFEYGDVKVRDDDTTPGKTETLAVWARRMNKQRSGRGILKILSWPTEASKVYKEWRRVESELETLNDFALELLWKDRRNKLPANVRRKMITKIWDEFELRTFGATASPLTRKAIEMSMPYVRNFKVATF